VTEIELPPGARAVLLGPDMVARALAGRQRDPQQRWLLQRPRKVRRSFVEDVIDGGMSEERWMLLQDKPTRDSYVADVQPDRQSRWLLGQPDAVRRSYVEDVIDG
jgi:hypothetical protein